MVAVSELECENEDCRDPRGQIAYTAFGNGDDPTIYCTYCYLVYERGMEAFEAAELTEELGSSATRRSRYSTEEIKGKAV